MDRTSKLVVGNTSLKDLFNASIACFDRIRLQFEPAEGHSRALLQLTVLKLRLSRWRNAVLNLIEARDPGIQDADGAVLAEYLQTIKSIFEQGSMENSHGQVTVPNKTASHRLWLVRVMQTISMKHLRAAYGEERTSSTHHSTFIISKENMLSTMILNIAAIVDNLEAFIPGNSMNQHLYRLRSEDVREIESQPECNKKDLRYLQESSMALDSRFATLLGKDDGGHEYLNNRARNEARLVQGDAFSNEYRGYVNEIKRGQHKYINTEAIEKAKVIQGDLYGFNPLD